MSSKVYFAPARVTKWKHSASLPGMLETMLKRVELGKRFKKDERVAVKTHFGSFGAHRIVRPIFLRKITDAIKSVGAKPFVTDTVRIKGIDYLEVANANGLNHLSLGAPVLLADGLSGHDNVLVDAGGNLGKVAIASAIHDVPAMVVVSHVKGHINAGYAGAIKNMAMGGISGEHKKCGWKCGRGAMHSMGHGNLKWSAKDCEFCYQCQEVCPLDCISFGDDGKTFTYNDKTCWRCGRCTRVCPPEALVHEGQDDKSFMGALAEATKAVADTFEAGKILYANFILEVQPECDCMPGADVPVVQDQGILLSDDIVAIEQASLDIIKKAAPLPQSAASDLGLTPDDDVLYKLSNRSAYIQMERCEELGLGTRDYELIKISGDSNSTLIDIKL